MTLTIFLFGCQKQNIIFNNQVYNNAYYDVNRFTNTTANTNNLSALNSCIDNVWFNITEAGGTPGFNNTFTFTNVESFKTLVLCAEYDGTTTHDVIVNVYNPSLNQYITVRQIASGSYINCNYFSFGGGAINLINKGNVTLQILHPTAGNPSHDLHINCLRLER